MIHPAQIDGSCEAATVHHEKARGDNLLNNYGNNIECFLSESNTKRGDETAVKPVI